MIASATAIVIADGTADAAAVVRLQSYNFQDRYVRHQNFDLRIDANISPDQDSQFQMVAGLANSSGYVSFESVNFPGYYLRHQNFDFVLARNDGSSLFRADATFRQVAGLANGSWASFQSYNFPNRYIRHYNFLLRLDPISDSVGRADATWRITTDGGSCGSGSFNAEAVQNGSTWTARNGSRQVYSGGDMRAAIQAAVDSLSPGRTSKQSVVVRGSGSMSAGSRIRLFSYTRLEVCGTINVTGSGSGDNAPVYARGAQDIEVSHLRVTGSPLYGIFMRNVDNLILGQIDMRLSGGLGIRIDNHGGDRAIKVRNVRIDNVYVSGTSSHGVETYGVDGLNIGTVIARNTGYSGLLLNDTINATVGTVDAQGAATGTGYAAFRMANRNGRVGGSYPTNIRVGTVKARDGGRGIFCVSESGGAVIDRIDIANTGNNAILIENCYNVTIAGQGGSISGGGEVRLAARSEFPNNSNITLQNFTLTNSVITERPCGVNIVIRNITLNNSQINRC